MQKPSLEGVSLKLDRAKERLAFLHDERVRLLELNRDRVVTEFNAKVDGYITRVDGEAPPLDWGLQIGDFAHALRSSLDNLLWQLILERGGTPDESTQFPIYESEAKFNRKARYKGPWTTEVERTTWGILAPDRTFIESRQPFKDGGGAEWHPLALLAHLNNVDKHRFVHGAYAAVAGKEAKGAAGVARFSDGVVVAVGNPGKPIEIRTFLWGQPFDPKLMFGHMPQYRCRAGGYYCLAMTGPVCDDPTHLAGCPGMGKQEAEVYVYPPLEVEISLSDGERPMTVFNFDRILDEVTGIVRHFEPVFV